ncbi:hypothetical protein Unana1_04325 [Umbelopsis nana]
MDIIFPSRTVVGQLVHSQYKPTVISLLQKVKVELVSDFNPLDPKHISDPKYESMSATDRANLAAELHRQRLQRTLQFIRPLVAIAVARSFVEIGWIDEAYVPRLRYTDHDDQSHLFRRPDDTPAAPAKPVAAMSSISAVTPLHMTTTARITTAGGSKRNASELYASSTASDDDMVDAPSDGYIPTDDESEPLQ